MKDTVDWVLHGVAVVLIALAIWGLYSVWVAFNDPYSFSTTLGG